MLTCCASIMIEIDKLDIQEMPRSWGNKITLQTLQHLVE